MTLTARTFLVPWAGLASGPAAWAISTQLNYALAPWACAHTNIIPLLGAILALLALLGGFISWRARDIQASYKPSTSMFLASLSAAIAVLFAAVIVTQGAAGLVFSGCEQ
jgi:hypothetical protein